MPVLAATTPLDQASFLGASRRKKKKDKLILRLQSVRVASGRLGLSGLKTRSTRQNFLAEVATAIFKGHNKQSDGLKSRCFSQSVYCSTTDRERFFLPMLVKPTSVRLSPSGQGRRNGTAQKRCRMHAALMPTRFRCQQSESALSFPQKYCPSRARASQTQRAGGAFK